MTIELIRSWAVIALMVSALFGCASPSQPTRFYRLDGELRTAGQIDLKPHPGIVQIGIAKVALAGYLDRPQIVERRSAHRLELHEFDQWAGSLQENLLGVMSDRLQHYLQTMQVIANPWHQSIQPDYELNLYISRFDRVGEEIHLQARWSLIERSGNRIVAMQQTTLQESFSEISIEAGVDAAAQAVSRLAEQIASVIREVVN
jgi:uncharacterized lipoprotein YmbA